MNLTFSVCAIEVDPEYLFILMVNISSHALSSGSFPYRKHYGSSDKFEQIKRDFNQLVMKSILPPDSPKHKHIIILG